MTDFAIINILLFKQLHSNSSQRWHNKIIPFSTAELHLDLAEFQYVLT